MTAPADRAATPVLSVVMVVFAGGSGIVRLLDALREQDDAGGAVEVIVATAPGAVDEDTLRATTPAARFVYGPAAAHPAELRALGVRAATGDVVACTEDHCVPARDWCARILAAHRATALAVGGPIQKLRPDSAIAWAAYLLEYGRFMPPVAGGPAERLSDCNVSYKRAALDEIADVWRDAFHETRVHDALRRRAGASALVLDPSMVVHQSRRPALLPFLGERFAHGRLFARLRAAQYGALARVAYGAGALGLTPLLVVRAVRIAWRCPDDRSNAVRALPHMALAAACWSAGEAVGAFTATSRP